MLMKRSKAVEDLCKSLGWSRTLFLEDFCFFESKERKDIVKFAQKGASLFRPSSEVDLRFALERSKVRAVVGVEALNVKDAMHHVRGGLDQVTCKLAVRKDVTICVSFADLLEGERAKMLARIAFNIELCKKYNVKLLFSTFAKDVNGLRRPKDLLCLWQLLGGDKQDLVASFI